MTAFGLDAIYNYLALLISERKPDQPLLITQMMPAVQFKFPDFTFEAYGLTNVRSFIEAGEKAGYFKLVNTGSVQTSFLSPGPKRPATGTLPGMKETTDPRQLRWMNDAMEALLRADRADQIMEAIRDLDWQAPQFDDYLVAEEKSLPNYTSRGKLRRVRDFLQTLKENGEEAAQASWRTSRVMLKMPTIPPNPPDAVRRQTLIWAILQGNASLFEVERPMVDALYFAVLSFSRDQLKRERAWDWVIALDILEVESRMLLAGKEAPRPTSRTGVLAARRATAQLSHVVGLDEREIQTYIAQLRRETGIRTTLLDPTPIWRGFVDTPSLDLSFAYLEDRPDILKDDKFLEWLDIEIGKAVQAGKMDIVRKLANKSAIVLAARQLGLAQLRETPMELKKMYEQVMHGVETLKKVQGFFSQPDTEKAAHYLDEHHDLLDDEGVGPILDEQLLRAAYHGSIPSYRAIRDRISLWRNVLDFGVINGIRQFKLEIERNPRRDRTLQAEMGIMLLTRTSDVSEMYDILERYPPIGTQEGLAMIDGMLDVLSFQGADQDEYNRHFSVKHLIERCIKVGIDRALAELK